MGRLTNEEADIFAAKLAEIKRRSKRRDIYENLVTSGVIMAALALGAAAGWIAYGSIKFLIGG